MFNFLAQRLNDVQPSPTLAMSSLARSIKESGEIVFDLTIGEPDFATPDNINNAAKVAIDQSKTRYTQVDGTSALKKAIAHLSSRTIGIDFSIHNVSVNCGAKHLIFNAMAATINEGDEVIIPSPYWVSYVDIVKLLGGKPIVIESSLENNFKITSDQLDKAITKKNKWFFINSPSNPSGAMYTKEELYDFSSVLMKNPNVHVLSDDIYEHIVYDDKKFFNVLHIEPQLKDRVLIVNGVSKCYAMTGWRIGYGVGNEQLIKAMSIIQSQSTSNPCSISQEAALEAITGTQVSINDMCKIFEKRRDFVLKDLANIPNISFNKPDGAFYIFFSIDKLIGKKTKSDKVINDCKDFAHNLLEDKRVATVPGSAFGCKNNIRISFASNEELLSNALMRLSDFISELV